MSLENVKVFGQNSIRIETEEGKRIYIDPLYIDRDYRDADYVLITHDHYDHFSPEDICKVINSDSIIVMPEKMKDNYSKLGLSTDNLVLVVPDEEYEVNDLKIETTYSYNRMKPFHPKSNRWVGYILDLDKKYYIAGDTDDIPEIENIECDVAFIPVGGTYTMNYKEAANYANILKPKIAVPVHYGTIVGKKEDGQSFADLLDDGIECKIMI